MAFNEDFLAAMEKQTAAIEENNTLTKGHRQEDNIGSKASKIESLGGSIISNQWRADDAQDEVRQSFFKLIGQSVQGVLGPQAQQGFKAIAPLVGIFGFAVNSELRGKTIDRINDSVEGDKVKRATAEDQLRILESEPRILAPKPAPGAAPQ